MYTQQPYEIERAGGSARELNGLELWTEPGKPEWKPKPEAHKLGLHVAHTVVLVGHHFPNSGSGPKVGPWTIFCWSQVKYPPCLCLILKKYNTLSPLWYFEWPYKTTIRLRRNLYCIVKNRFYKILKNVDVVCRLPIDY